MTREVDESVFLDQAMAVARDVMARGDGRMDFAPEDPLVDIGFSSLDMANLMIAVEAKFDVTIPPSRLTPDDFRSVRSIALMIMSLEPQNGAAPQG